MIGGYSLTNTSFPVIMGPETHSHNIILCRCSIYQLLQSHINYRRFSKFQIRSINNRLGGIHVETPLVEERCIRPSQVFGSNRRALEKYL